MKAWLVSRVECKLTYVGIRCLLRFKSWVELKNTQKNKVLTTNRQTQKQAVSDRPSDSLRACRMRN